MALVGLTGTGAAGSFNAPVNVNVEPDRYWRDYTLSVWATLDGDVVGDPSIAQARCDGTEPPMPTNLSVECAVPSGSLTPLVEVSWDAPTGITTGSYEVEGDLTYTGVSTSFSRTGAFLAEYEVRARAYDSTNSQWTYWTGYESDTCPIADPTDVIATCVSNEIVATWTDPAADPDTQFSVAVAITEPGSSVDNVAETVTATEFRKTGTWLNGTTVEFQVQAVNNGEYSSQVSAPDTVCTNYPTGLDVQCAVSSGNVEVTLEWDAVAGMTSYEVTGDLTYNGADTESTHTGAYGQSYTVQVRATDGTTTTGWSPTETGECPPTAPTITSMSTLTECVEGDLKVRWSVSTLVDSYEIELDNGSTVMTHTGLASTLYQQSGVDARTEFDIRVRAVNASGNSPWSASSSVECEKVLLTASTATLTADMTPDYNRAAGGTLTRVGVTGTATFDFSATWTAPSDTYGCAVTGYNVELYLSPALPGTGFSRNGASTGTTPPASFALNSVDVEGDYYIAVIPVVQGGHIDCGGTALSPNEHTDIVPYACPAWGQWT